MEIGFIGLGNMGLPMAQNLCKSGFSVSVYNRTRDKAQRAGFSASRICKTPAELTSKVDIVLSCLADEEANELVFCGPEGVFQGLHSCRLIVDHSTVSPGMSKRFSQRAEEKGADFLDAPVSGGPEGAQAGSLAIMCGGVERAFQKALPLFQSMGETIVHMGACGSGSTTKLINQILVGIHTVASCEAMLMAEASGVDPEKLVQVLRNSWGASRMLARNAPLITARQFGPSAAPVRNLEKDLRIAVDTAAGLGIDFPMLKTAHQISRRAGRKGLSLCDIASLYQMLEKAGS